MIRYIKKLIISCRACNAVYLGETGRSVRTRKLKHVDAVKTFNTKMSTLSQHVMNFNHRIYWGNVKILKSESHAYRRRVAESFLINQKACSSLSLSYVRVSMIQARPNKRMGTKVLFFYHPTLFCSLD